MKFKKKTAYVVVNKENPYFACRVVILWEKGDSVVCERHGYTLEIPKADLKKESVDEMV